MFAISKFKPMKYLALLFAIFTLPLMSQNLSSPVFKDSFYSGDSPNSAIVSPAPLGFNYSTFHISPDVNVRSIFRDKQGQLWFGASNGLYLSSDNGQLFKCGAGTCNHDTQVKRVKYLHDLEIEKHFTNIIKDRGLIDFHVTCMAQDKQGVYWIGTKYHGLVRYNGKDFTFYSKQDGLGDNWVTSIVIANDATIWIGTLGGVGKSQFASAQNPSKKSFVTYKITDGLPSNKINSILIDKSNQLWISTDKGAVVYANNKFSVPQLIGDRVVGKVNFIEESLGKLWVADDKGILIIDQKKSRRIGRGQGLPTSQVSTLHHDTYGNLWVAMLDEKENGAGLFKIDHSSIENPKSKLKLEKIEPPFSKSIIETIFEDISGDIWIGTSNGVGCVKNGKLHWLVVSMEGC
jgi:ligand-binding sensor domain-containing protein